MFRMPPTLGHLSPRHVTGGRGSRRAALLATVLALAGFSLVAGCPSAQPVPGPVFNNTTDPTNGGASFIGSAACSACHADIAELSSLHGHSFMLNPIAGAPPEYPVQAERAGVPDPPAGQTFDDVSYVIGGYTHYALFVRTDGFLMTDGTEGVPTQWNLAFRANGTPAGFVSFMPGQTEPLPYAFDCFRCHTVEPQPQTAASPLSQDNRPGILGTWAEPGVRCEACHGPGSNHVPRPSARDLFVDSSAKACGRCHTEGDDPEVILAAGGFIVANTQFAELRASGGHANFACTVCHDPHASSTYDPARGIRNACTVCHPDRGLAAHAGVTFTRGDYSEPVTCQSCHMPFATLTASVATAAIVGEAGRMADTRTHIFRINVNPVPYTALFTADQTRVEKDEQGRAAVPLGFVCLRCHNDAATPNSAFPLGLDIASEIATDMHAKFDGGVLKDRTP
jgi:hypothetical protein